MGARLSLIFFLNPMITPRAKKNFSHFSIFEVVGGKDRMMHATRKTANLVLKRFFVCNVCYGHLSFKNAIICMLLSFSCCFYFLTFSTLLSCLANITGILCFGQINSTAQTGSLFTVHSMQFQKLLKFFLAG